jgi:hypothetical protein
VGEEKTTGNREEVIRNMQKNPNPMIKIVTNALRKLEEMKLIKLNKDTAPEAVAIVILEEITNAPYKVFLQFLRSVLP